MTFLITAIILSGFWYLGSALTALLLIVAAAVGLRQVLAQHTWQSFALSPLMLLYLAWLFVITFTSTMPNASLLDAAVLAGLPVMYLSFTSMRSLANQWEKLRIALLLMGIILAAWGLGQVFFHVGHGLAQGPLKDRNAFAALMNVLWFPAAFLFLTHLNAPHRMLAVLSGFGVLIMNAALFATASRGGIAVWCVLLPIFLWAAYRNRLIKKTLLLLPLIAIVAYFFSDLFLHSTVADRTFHLASDASTGARLLMWQSAWHIALDHPLFGTGWGSFFAYYPAYRSPLEVQTVGGFAHNDYLQFASEGGFPAMLLLAALGIGVAWRLRRSLAIPPNLNQFESICLLLGVLALFLHAALNFIFYYAFMNILAGLYLARAAQLTETPRPIPLPGLNQLRPSIRRFTLGAIVIGLSTPYTLHLLVMETLTGKQPILTLIHTVAPNVRTKQIGKIAYAMFPQDLDVQEYILQRDTSALKVAVGNPNLSAAFQRHVLTDTLAAFDEVRTHNANNANVGAGEAGLLLDYQYLLPDHLALNKAWQILRNNLKADPYSTDSIIMLARLQKDEGHALAALETLRHAQHHVLFLYDQQMLEAEILRERAEPRVMPELNQIVAELNTIRHDSKTGNLSPDTDRIESHIVNQLSHVAHQ
jgi:O-antigen ligase